jgi:RNA polymerase sigma-70 factor (ECF subfamily)
MGVPDRHRALEQMVEEHYVSLYRYAYRLTGCPAAADDLAQETFCKAQTHFEQLREPSRAKAWLFRILRNAYLQSRREEQHHRLVSLDTTMDVPAPAEEPLPEIDPAQLQTALDELPEVFRTPIILYYFSEFSYRDIAEQMDLPLGTVMSRLARAKAHLRGRLSRAFPPAESANGRMHSPSPQPLSPEGRGASDQTPSQQGRGASGHPSQPVRRASDGL